MNINFRFYIGFVHIRNIVKTTPRKRELFFERSSVISTQIC